MDGKARLFLTREEAVEAIRIDFEQYAPQLGLFASLYPLVADGAASVGQRDGVKGISITRTNGGRDFIPGDEAGQRIWDALCRAKLDLAELARVCGKVFWGPTEVGPECPGGERGIWLETGVERFRCRRCGTCCFTLDFRCECTQDDLARWKANGREDIMEWVGDVFVDGQWLRNRLWVRPGTHLPVEYCPWMVQRPDGGYSCGIQDVKPDVCRDYPGSVKHGALTGCNFFADEQRCYREMDKIREES
ncbi:Fe-S-cluster containining protein [Desulfobaculum xiamenense]|uniref:Fe-S-cluster containining protein n=1 Tax=Desulfobaculum xiamenense TaxID=995050 RepID=A0A846QHS3_9BACT|nr:hypothetical protein [Desulfobaculum xiamenense]NJB67751.1 Fe-S-cluster containining protein [Desulfobaculum xiamenense]